jgi:hypothetical protein
MYRLQYSTLMKGYSILLSFESRLYFCNIYFVLKVTLARALVDGEEVGV